MEINKWKLLFIMVLTSISLYMISKMLYDFSIKLLFEFLVVFGILIFLFISNKK